MNSRNLQNLLHIVASLNEMLLLMSGIFLGAQKWLIGICCGMAFFTLKRLTSEIFYRILIKIEKEEKNEKI